MSRIETVFPGDLSYSLRRYYVDEFHLRHVPSLEPGSIALDLGGARSEKRGVFNIASCNLKVFYANLSAARRPDVRARAESLPFPDEAFDSVICSEVLEHVLSPPTVLREVFRVLKCGGTVLMCAPFLMRIHGDPDDYGRYTDSYWMETLTSLGFYDIRVEKQGGFWSVLVEMVRYLVCTKTEPWGPNRNWIVDSIARVMNYCKRTAVKWDYAADSGRSSTPGGFTTGFGIRARRP